MTQPFRVPAALRAVVKGSVCLAALSASLIALPDPAEANWFSSGPSAATAQAEGRWHKGPRGYHAMCAREPKLCMHDYQAAQNTGSSAPARLDDARWDALDALNRDINWQIRPVEDRGRDHWTKGVYQGDCEDYVIAKKQALIAAGWSADQLLYAVVEGVYSPYHLVLVVRTGQGDFVLDNLTDRIHAWEDSGYTFVVRQSADNPTQWAYVDGNGLQIAEAGRGGLATR
ncbi:MAG: transglutaminase-like cysteine peptidase [Pseudomonadota bacterium]